MGTVVTLPPRRATSPRATRTDDATILLFMGVRYVRDFEAAEPIPSAGPESQADVDHELPPLEIA